MDSLAEHASSFDGEKALANIQLRQTLAFRLLHLVLVDIQILLEKLYILSRFTHVVAFRFFCYFEFGC